LLSKKILSKVKDLILFIRRIKLKKNEKGWDTLSFIVDDKEVVKYEPSGSNNSVQFAMNDNLEIGKSEVSTADTEVIESILIK
jgi:hypothetical protein